LKDFVSRMKLSELAKLASELKIEDQFKRLQFLAVGFENVEVESFDETMQRFKTVDNRKITERWQHFAQAHDKVFDGNLASVKAVRIVNNSLKIQLRLSSFSRYIGTRSSEPRPINLSRKILDEDYALPLTVGSVTVTKDNWIMLGVKKREVRTDRYLSSSANYISLIPLGYFDPDEDMLNRKYRPDLTIWREFAEELGMERAGELHAIGLICDFVEKQQPLLVFRLDLPLRKVQVQRQIEGLSEHSGLVFFPDGNFQEMRELLNKSIVSTHALGAIMLHTALSNK